MPNLSRAESILSLFTTPDHASNIAGDLAEQFNPQGPFQFWRHLLGTAFALFLQQLEQQPMRNFMMVSVCLILTEIALSGIVPSALFPMLPPSNVRHQHPVLFAITLETSKLLMLLLIARAATRINPTNQLSGCAALGIATALISILLPGRLPWFGLIQWNVAATILFLSVGVRLRLRSIRSFHQRAANQAK